MAARNQTGASQSVVTHEYKSVFFGFVFKFTPYVQGKFWIQLEWWDFFFFFYRLQGLRADLYQPDLLNESILRGIYSAIQPTQEEITASFNSFSQLKITSWGSNCQRAHLATEGSWCLHNHVTETCNHHVGETKGQSRERRLTVISAARPHKSQSTLERGNRGWAAAVVARMKRGS